MTQIELLHLAKTKAAGLEPGTQIRLTAEEKSYWVLRDKGGSLYIASLSSEPMPEPFFKNRTLYNMVNRNGEVIGTLQHLL